MSKKILLGLFILLIGVVSIIGYNFYKNTRQPLSQNSIIAVPQNAALILQEKNFRAVYNKISSTNIIWEELVQNTTLAKEIDFKLYFLDSVIQLQSFQNIYVPSQQNSASMNVRIKNLMWPKKLPVFQFQHSHP